MKKPWVKPVIRVISPEEARARKLDQYFLARPSVHAQRDGDLPAVVAESEEQEVVTRRQIFRRFPGLADPESRRTRRVEHSNRALTNDAGAPVRVLENDVFKIRSRRAGICPSGQRPGFASEVFAGRGTEHGPEISSCPNRSCIASSLPPVRNSKHRARFEQNSGGVFASAGMVRHHRIARRYLTPTVPALQFDQSRH